MRARRERLVSVVVPAYNAALTIDETLGSVRGQTYRHLEILVVDDGSTDATREIAEAHAARDSRVKVIRQSNAGVAAARNRGIAESEGDLVAPIDADDVWRQDKIERQVDVLESAGPKVGLVYCWYAAIDGHTRVRSLNHRPTGEGDVLATMCLSNLVGNGSAPLMWKTAIQQAGGYDEGLRLANAQGCEDLKLYIQIAENYHFALIREHLVGYRRTPANMSSDLLQMLRSHDIVMTEVVQRHPRFGDLIRAGRNGFLKWLLVRAIRASRYTELSQIARIMLEHDRVFAMQTFALLPLTLARAKIAPTISRLLQQVTPQSPRLLGPFPMPAIDGVTVPPHANASILAPSEKPAAGCPQSLP